MPTYKHLQRYRQIVGILVDEGFDNALDFTGLRRFAPVKSRLRGSGVSPEPVPVRLRHTLERLGPTFVKLGQAASTRSDILPDAYIVELQKLQDQVAPISFEQVREIVEHELGGPLEEVFAEFSSEPLASASIGQVHSARLIEGDEVCVKVQRPGVREQVETDLDIVMTQARFMQRRSEDSTERYDVVAIAEEFANAIRGELDYVVEARRAERLAEMFEGDDTVAFPAISWDYTTTTVLTMERFEGIPFNRIDLLDEAGADKCELAKRGIFCYLEQIFTHGYYHADPHPGNLFALPDGRVGFTDFGRMGTISQVGRDQLADLFISIVDGDSELATDVLYEAAGSPPDIDPTALERDVSRLLAKYSNRSLSEVSLSALIRDVFNLVRAHHLLLSSELALLLATLAVLEGLGTQLCPEFDFIAVTAPFARRISTQRMGPRAFFESLGSSARRLSRVLNELPNSVLRLTKRVSQGDFRFSVRALGLDPYMIRLEEMVNRLAFALIVAAFVIGLSILLADTDKPQWFIWFARIAEAMALVVGSWFFLSVMIDRSKRGKR